MYLGAHLDTQTDKPAIVMGSGFHQTFAELDAAANRFSRVLRGAGIRPGDHVAVCMENHNRYLEVIWGFHYAGAVYTGCSSRLTSSELGYMLNDCGARVFVTSMHKAEQAAELIAAAPSVELWLMLDGTIDHYESYEQTVALESPTELDEPRVGGTDMLYSSGTTGLPKGIARPFEASPLDSPASGIFGGLFGFGCDSVYLSPAPFYHAAPLRFCLAAQSLGSTVVAMENFDAEEYLSLIEQYRVTHTQVVPTMFVRLLRLPEEVRSKYDVSSLECVIHAAAPCPVPVKQQMIEWLGPVLCEYYSGTESNGITYCNSEMWLSHLGTVGTPLGCTVHICGDDLQELPHYESGTIYFEGGPGFEYHNDPDKTRSSRHPLGWSTLGDIGYLDDDNFLYLTDRKAYLIISGGVNIYPQETENVLITHPDVIDVAVFGVPNDDFGEEVKAVVQPREMPLTPESAAALSRELIAYARSQLADVKCPRTIDYRAELPRQATGKLFKRLLKDEYWSNEGRKL
jgi:acyl-CoA synthetase (AMP-forming)/AMP-acid ligase II